MLFGSITEKFSRFRNEISNFGLKIINDWSFSLAALIGYYLLMSLLPLILCLFSATYFLFGNDQYYVNQTRDRLLESFPQQNFDELIVNLTNSIAGQAVSVFLISFLVSVFTGSRLFTGIDDVLVIIYRLRERTLLNQNFHAIKMLLVFITLLPVIIISSSLLALLKQREQFYYFLIVFLSGLFLFLLFMCIFFFVPSRTMRCGKIWCGSLCAAIALQLLFFIFPAYVHLFMKDYIGQFGFLIITLLLFYIFGLILVLAAQINAYFFEHIPPLTTSLGNYVNGYNDGESIRLIDGDMLVSTAD